MTGNQNRVADNNCIISSHKFAQPVVAEGIAKTTIEVTRDELTGQYEVLGNYSQGQPNDINFKYVRDLDMIEILRIATRRMTEERQNHALFELTGCDQIEFV